jgi:hypothetical protein
MLALVLAVALFAAGCTDEGKAKVKAAASSLAPGGVPSASVPASPSESSPGDSPTDTLSPEASESPDPSPTETAESSPTSRPTLSPRPSPSPSPSPTPVETSPSTTASETPPGEAGASSSNTAWIWILLALAVIALIVVLAARARSRGRAGDAWKSRARDPYSKGVVLHDRLASELAGPEMTNAQIDDALAEFDGISQQLNALSLDAPDDRARQALGQLLMTMGTLRPTLEQVKLAADPLARQQESGLARGRLMDFDAALRAFRSTVWPETTPGA